jgi:hypothetical protein
VTQGCNSIYRSDICIGVKIIYIVIYRTLLRNRRKNVLLEEDTNPKVSLVETPMIAPSADLQIVPFKRGHQVTRRLK